MVFRQSRSFVKQGSSRLLEPAPENDLERVILSGQIDPRILIFLRIDRPRAAEGYFVHSLTDGEFNHIAPPAELHAVFIGPPRKAVKWRAAYRAPLVEAPGASLRLRIFQAQVSIAAESRDHALDDYARLLLVLLLCSGSAADKKHNAGYKRDHSIE